MPITVEPARSLSRSAWLTERRPPQGPGGTPSARALADYAGGVRRPLEERFPRPSVMGVVNVTPDSFSDGGVNFRLGDAVASARRMVEEGAAIVDIGGESTRPGSDAVAADEELRRVVPVLEELGGTIPVSIDTAKAEVARRAIELGAELVNDVTALRGDPELAEVVASSGAYLCLMHMQGEPRTMQDSPTYKDVAAEVASFLEKRLGVAVDAGIPEERICLDPGFGFGKSVEQNFELLGRLGEIVALGRPVLVGLSRKRSLGRILGDPHATTGPLSASLAAAVEAYERGAAIFRVHDVREHVEALTVAAAVPR
jgi:dihydropteroate synthase